MAKLILCFFVISTLGCNNSFHSLPSEGDHNNLSENLSVVHTFDRLILTSVSTEGSTSWIHELGGIVDSFRLPGISDQSLAAAIITANVSGEEARDIKEMLLQDSSGKKIEDGYCSGSLNFYSCYVKVTGYEKFDCSGFTQVKPRGGTFEIIATLRDGGKKTSTITFPDQCLKYNENPLYTGAGTGKRKVASVSAITHQFNNVWLVCAISVAIGFLLAFLYSTSFKRQ